MALVFAGVFAVLAGLSLLKGGVFISEHEGDTIHLLQIVLRMAAGDMAHIDFVTPIGMFAFAPIALFASFGLGAGMSFILGQALVAALALPAIWWVAASRYRGAWAYVFGVVTLGLILALIAGETTRAVSVSMHYNRWAWAAAFLAISTAVLPSYERQSRVADGLVIGLALACMALIKITFFVAFLPAIAVALLARKSWRTILVGLIAGLLVAGIVTLFAGGTTFWLHYLANLANVAASDVRPKPSLPFEAVIGAPAYIVGSLVALLGVVLLRQSGRAVEGLALLLLVPAFFYVTYQNSGNDPQWLMLLALMLMVLRPAREIYNGLGWELHKGLTYAAIAGFVLISGSAINLIYSPIRNYTQDTEKYVQLVPGSQRVRGVYTSRARAMRVDLRWAEDEASSVYGAHVDSELRTDVTEFMGERLPQCAIDKGLVAVYASLADDLKANGLVEGKSIFAADLLNASWLYGASEPLKHGSPWYYGGLPGYRFADYLLVPLCAQSTFVRKLVLGAVSAHVEAGKSNLTEAYRNAQYVLYEVQFPAQ